MKKSKIIVSEYRHTTVIEGSSLLFFVCFWTTKAGNLLLHRGGVSAKIVRWLFRSLPSPRFIVENPGGIFVVRGFDDSLAIIASYFESAQKQWLSLSPHKALMIDVGANRGIYCILALLHYGYQRAIAFEPQQEMREEIAENAILNRLQKRLITDAHALGDQIGETSFVVDPLHRGGGRISGIHSKFDITTTIATTTLDSTLTSSEQRSVGFIKIDTEGYEFTVLSGMHNTLTAMPRGSALMIESTNLDQLRKKLSPYNFAHTQTILHDHLFLKQ